MTAYERTRWLLSARLRVGDAVLGCHWLADRG